METYFLQQCEFFRAFRLALAWSQEAAVAFTGSDAHNAIGACNSLRAQNQIWLENTAAASIFKNCAFVLVCCAKRTDSDFY